MDPIAGATGASFLPTSNGDYFLQIQSNILCSNFSDVYSVANIGLDEENLSGFELYPNPATTRLNFKVQGTADVRIMDASGRLVYTGALTGTPWIDVSEWARGVYMIQVLRGSETTATPVVLK